MPATRTASGDRLNSSSAVGDHCRLRCSSSPSQARDSHQSASKPQTWADSEGAAVQAKLVYENDGGARFSHAYGAERLPGHAQGNDGWAVATRSDLARKASDLPLPQDFFSPVSPPVDCARAVGESA